MCGESRGREEVPLSLRRAPSRRSLAPLSPFIGFEMQLPFEVSAILIIQRSSAANARSANSLMEN
nr:MAG TPA: hypothetical protein [Caudoviricetes sp.]